ncbi:hypothetical protein BDQ17DRAFT_1430150 [Cyathus striatus]|nr:hypothetical protein BDQ17DRAFT_1430150 [Cyathus striatus]
MNLRIRRQFKLKNRTDSSTSTETTPSPSENPTDSEQDVFISGFKQILDYPISYRPILEGYPATTYSYPPDRILFTRMPSLNDQHGITQCILPSEMKARIMHIQGFPRVPLFPQVDVYRIGPTISKGLGLFSTDIIQIGQFIITERPLLFTPFDTLLNVQNVHKITPHSTDSMMTALSGALVDLLVTRMTPENQRAFLELHNAHPRDWEGVIHGMFRTNSLEVTVRDLDMRFKVVTKDMARVNHSCEPNAVYDFDLPSFSVRLYAILPISKGEEITISYVPLESAENRASYLQDNYAIPSCTSLCCKNAT